MTARVQSPRVGEVRQSQVLFTFGIGAAVDLPFLSVLVMGLEDWNEAHARELTEDRLLGAVRAQLGPQVARLRLPPMPAEGSLGLFDPFGEEQRVGVPVAPFPRWVRCPSCDLLAPIHSGQFELRTEPFRPDQARYVHGNCAKARSPEVLPARFLVACPRGHLDDFPWAHYVHGGSTTCRGALRLLEQGVSGEARDVFVRCEACGAARSMVNAFGEDALTALPACRGRRPHLRDFAEAKCAEPVRTILLGASNSWFPIALTALTIPQASERLAALVETHWDVLKNATSREILVAFRPVVPALRAFADVDDAALWEAVERHRSAPPPAASVDLKPAEWDAFSQPDPERNTRDFRLREVERPRGFEHYLERVVLVERLREVRALVGFTRIESPGDYGDPTEVPAERRGTISRNPPRWVPASEVRGEGVFLQFSERAISAWCRSSLATAKDRELISAHRDWRIRRHIAPPEAGFPGIRYVLLHSLAHVLIRQFSVECGYGAASIRERIYARDPGTGVPMAGLLIYTAAPDSEGTLGGLVELGKPENLRRHLSHALARAGLCSSDPLCAEHTPRSEGLTLHGAACHACLFLPETSCERGNRYLDRALLVPTFGLDAGAFFASGGRA